MTTITELQRKLDSFNEYARKSAKKTDAVSALQTKWKSLFSDSLSDTSANTFVKYYRDMTQKQQGGMAPLTYAMTPGANVSVYGKFPTEVSTDMGSIRDLDVYFQNSLTTGCGTENSSLTVPVEMGSNKVGGKRNSRKLNKSNKSRKLNKSRKQRKNNLRSARKTRVSRRARHYGGSWSLSDAIPDYRPYWASAPPNPLQASMASYQGITPPISAPSSPVDHTWKYVSNGSVGLIDPGQVANIKSDLSALANPAPWQKA